MRLIQAVLLLFSTVAPALAQPATAPDPTSPAPMSPVSTGSVPTSHSSHSRRTAAQHFTDANTTHDGHLTLDQATAGYKTIAKAFNQIDVSHHGYVTMDDIKAWRAAKKAARLAAKHAASDNEDGIVRPGQPIQRWLGPKPTETSTDMVVPAPSEPRRTGVDLPKAPLDGANPS